MVDKVQYVSTGGDCRIFWLPSTVSLFFFQRVKLNFLDRLVGNNGTATAMRSMAMTDLVLIERH